MDTSRLGFFKIDGDNPRGKEDSGEVVAGNRRGILNIHDARSAIPPVAGVRI
jgi:hypothetical protein